MAGVRVVHIATVSMSPWVLMRYQIEQLKRAGADLHIVCGEDRFFPELAALGCPIHRVSLTRRVTPIADLRAFFQLIWLLKRLAPAVVHTYTPKASLLGQWAAWLTKVPRRIGSQFGLLFTERTSPLKRWALVQIEWLAALPAQQILAINPSQLQLIARSRIAAVSKLRPWTIGVDLERFSPAARDALRPTCRGALGLSEGDVAVGMLGRLNGAKGFGTFIEVARSVLPRESRAVFLWAGPSDLPPHQVDAWVKGVVGDRFRILGPVGDQRDFLVALDVLLFPSMREGMPITLQEAAALGLPIVTTDAPGCRDVVADGESGLVFPAGDAARAASCLQRVLDDPGLARHVGAGAAAWAAAHADRRSGLGTLFDAYAGPLDPASLDDPIPTRA